MTGKTFTEVTAPKSWMSASSIMPVDMDYKNSASLCEAVLLQQQLFAKETAASTFSRT